MVLSIIVSQEEYFMLLCVGNQDGVLGVLVQDNPSLGQRRASLFSNMRLPEEQNTRRRKKHLLVLGGHIWAWQSLL